MLRSLHMALSKKEDIDSECQNLVENSHFLSSEIQFSIKEKIYAQTYLRWCSIIYWEYDCVSSKQFHVFDNQLWVYQENEMVNDRSNLCLKKNQKYTEKYELIKTRELIRNGILIRLTKNRVFIENKSCSSLFWIKPSLKTDLSDFRPNEIKKDNTVQVFNLRNLDDDNYYMNTNVVNLSFGKQWGSNNTKRPSIEFCPCWIIKNFYKADFLINLILGPNFEHKKTGKISDQPANLY
ncbi:mothers against decapentaplegic -like protein [Brachionus plicatilis]|uniref:Mothers against decapentaplegic-like protein n=1 Tax=Brachionus plicatilis TaxID=10195 RepID=A0A3M7S4A3_BRAPC|nr:mothers against decapentaplegic -like protein [Brachionus plicatilis]